MICFEEEETMTKTFYQLFVLVILMGCSAKRLAVSHADGLLTNQVEKRIPLYSKQKKQLNADIKAFLNKHKKTIQEMIPILDELGMDRKLDYPGTY